MKCSNCGAPNQAHRCRYCSTRTPERTRSLFAYARNGGDSILLPPHLDPMIIGPPPPPTSENPGKMTWR